MLKSFTASCSRYGAIVFQNALRLFEPLLYPLKCLKCGVYIDPDHVEPHSMESCFCDGCMSLGFFPIEIPFCTRCGIRFHSSSHENHVCESCLKTPLMIDRVRAAVEYKGIIKDAVPLFKYHSKLAVAKVFERLLFQAFLRHYAQSPIDLVMPIPLHARKLRKRGFNQAFFLVRNFVRQYQHLSGWPPVWRIDTCSLERMKPTQPQTGFNTDQRKANLKNAFKVVNENAIDHQHILLVDDVFTTGATCNEAARTLLMHGARKVDALVLART